MIDPDHDDQFYLDEWDEGDAADESEGPPPWRRPLLIFVSAITALALAVVPLYNFLFARQVADNGLEVCGFDYCVVQDDVVEAGLDLEMSRLANTFLDEDEARSLANELTEFLGIDPVGLEVVDHLDGSVGGWYDPETRSISIERPARAWTVVHEVSHAVEPGHGPDFRHVVIELAAHLESIGG